MGLQDDFGGSGEDQMYDGMASSIFPGARSVVNIYKIVCL